MLVLFYGHLSWHARPHGDRSLTARTLTGRRTIDLALLAKVGRVEVPGPRLDDRLILTDAHGVRLITHKLRGGDETVDALVRRALLRHPQGAGVVVSHRAAERLGLEAELTRAHGRLRPGRKVRLGLIGWLPLLSLLVLAPGLLGLTFLAWILAYGT
ncbi:PH domain-containing protein OS=Streptomyces alboniger OX=132473 GN=CP975_33605 PE=4 SV=1 [Streptomyces alboniger]